MQLLQYSACLSASALCWNDEGCVFIQNVCVQDHRVIAAHNIAPNMSWIKDFMSSCLTVPLNWYEALVPESFWDSLPVYADCSICCTVIRPTFFMSHRLLDGLAQMLVTAHWIQITSWKQFHFTCWTARPSMLSSPQEIIRDIRWLVWYSYALFHLFSLPAILWNRTQESVFKSWICYVMVNMCRLCTNTGTWRFPHRLHNRKMSAGVYVC